MRGLRPSLQMNDKAGVEITVGCRVAGADFSFGDGKVESVTVPSVGRRRARRVNQRRIACGVGQPRARQPPGLQ